MKNFSTIVKTVLLSAFLFVGNALMAQITVSGTVIDGGLNEPIIGASVLEVGTTNGTITDFDGNFELTVAPGATLQFSYVGFQTQTLKAEKSMRIVLEEDNVMLQEVVAIGYGSQKKKEVTGSVASLKAEDFNAGVKSNPVGLLQGKVAGLNITKTSSDPTQGGYAIQIRGFSTLGKGTGNSPLYIVDGVPVSGIDNIAPEEIASMDVLKDGSAAAIYGTRGTNGVIIITTKRANTSEGAECGKTQVEYSGYVSASVPRKKTGMATAEEFRNLYELSGGKVTPSIYSTADGTSPYNTDWMSQLVRPAAITHNHNLAISGNTKKFGYRASIGYKGAEGIAKNNDRQEIIAKFAADQKALEGWLNLQYDLSYMHYKNNYFCGDFKQGATLNPTYPIYDSSTESGYFLPSGSGQSNPVAAMDQKESNQSGNYFRGSVKATVNILPVEGLKVSAFAALEEGDNNSYWYNSQLFDSDKDNAGKAGRNNDLNFNQLYEATIDYAGQWGYHTLSAVLGFSYQKFFYDGENMTNGGFPTDNYKYYSMYDGLTDKSLLNVGSYRNSNVLVSGFARVNYNYKEKYLVSLSVRREGSSRFGDNHKWGWFPAASAGWRISGEDFMRDAEWVNDLKLRAGFGVTGNNLGSDLASKQLLTTGGTFWYNGAWVTSYGVNQNANPDLRWEKKYEYNVGIDFAFLQNRLSGTIDMYYRDTKDLLWEYDVPTPPYQFNKLLANCGEIVSKGIEISLTGIPVKTKDWEWASTFTIAFNDNKIKKLSDPDKGLNYSEMLTGSVGENGIQGVNTQKIVEGQSIGAFYGYKFIGINPKTNNLVYEKDENGKNKLQFIGNAQPLFTFGWNNTIRWRNLDLTLFFRGVYGNDVLNVKRWAYGPQKSQGLNVFMKDVKALANGTGVYRQGVFSDYYLEDGSYIKLDNITLGYTFHFKDNRYIQSLRLHATAENVFTLAGYSGIDPEVNTTDVWSAGIDASGFYPSVCNVLVGLNVTL
ncbi:MAG: TonB-dependent receptor [Paludibacteraceae bacterium]|nr:TonB-dependent receptor [Paludibacteraceae bacterium]